MSNRLTFSLASLFLIFTMAFVPTAVMAATGGPTVTLAEYSGVEDPAIAAAGQDNHEQARDDFRVKLTFSHSVAAPAAADVMVRLRTAGVFAAPIEASAVVEVFESGGKVYVATLAAVTANTVTQVHVSIDDDAVDGNRDNLLGNVGSSMTFTLPALIPATVKLKLAEAKPVTGMPGRYTIVAGFTNTASGASAVPALEPPFTLDHVKVVPEGAATVFSVADGTGDDADSTAAPWVARQVITLDLTFGTTSVSVSVDEGYIVGGNTVMVPPAEAPDPVPPMAAITIEDYMLADDGEASFFISVMFSGGDTVKPAMLGVDLLDVKDSSDPAQMVTLTEGLNQKIDNSYKARMTFDYDPRFLTLPLIIKVDQGEVKTSNPNHSKMVGEATSTTPMAKDPTAEIAVSGVNIGERTFTVEVMLTPGMKADGSAGDPIKGFGKDDLEIMGENDSTPRITIVDENMADNSYLAELQWNPLSTRNLPFTVKAILDDSGDDTVYYMDTSDPAMDAMATVGMEDDTTPPVLTLTKGDPDATTGAVTVTIASSEALKAAPTVSAMGMPVGHDATYMVSDVTMGTADNTYMVTVTPTAAADLTADVPALTVTLTVMAMDTSDNSVTMGNTIDVMLAARTAPTTRPPGPPTGVGAKADQAANTIAISWTAPADDGGTAITGYTVTKHYMKDSVAASKDFSAAATASSLTIPPTGSADMLPQGVPFTFTVKAMNSVGTGPASASSAAVMIDVDPTVPGMPTNLVATANQDTNMITLTWDAPEDTGGAAITGYAVTMNGRPQRSVTTTTFTTSRLAANTYTFTVAAMNSVGTGAPTGSKAAVIDPDPTVTPPTPGAPSAPTNVEAIANQDTNIITVTWGAPTNDGGARITSYSVKMNGAVQRSVTATNFTTSRLTAGTYTFEVAAVNSRGTGPTASDAAVINPDPVRPPVTPVTPAILLPPGIPDIGASYASMETTLRGTIAPNSFGVVLADDLPDLEDFFRQKGTIVLDDGASAKKRSVLISEILWGLDAGEPPDTQDRRQFIELYNTSNTTAVSVTGWKLKFTLGRPAPAEDVDRVSNAGTIVDPGWFMDIGQSGVLTGTTLAGTSVLGGTGVPTDIISAYRNINYNAVQSSQDLKNDHTRAGHVKGSWKASQRITTQVGIKASPGARHFIELGPLTKSTVSRSPFIINEIGNAPGSDNDWIELRNVTDTEKSLKNYQLSVVTSDKKDTQLFNFHDQDYKVPAKGVILIANTDPSTNDLAGGDNAAKGANDEVLEGATHLYVVPTKFPDKKSITDFNIPDDGNILLILRNNHEAKHLGTGNQLVDVIGTLSIQDASRGTALWPLYVWGGPNGNVVKNGDENFGAGKVYQRNNTNADGKEAIEIRGYTGVGYDRHASDNSQNGGTPGYDNGAVKHKYSDFSGDITISEIMLETEEETEAGRVPRATRLPQWIELYNNSMTQAVKIHNWHLEIQNDDTAEFKGNLHGTIQLKDITVQPNQTVLIVSNSGLNSGNFPAQRTINVFLDGNYRRILGLQSRGDQMLNPAGFYIELRDHEHRSVDEVGNLGVSRRTGTNRRDNFGEQWELPSLYSEDGHRTSLIRVYKDGEAENGLNQGSWNRAADVGFQYVPSLTYFGNHRDFGTPGYRGGGPLPVSLSKFRPQRLDTGEVVIHWTTESELNNAGFNILRTEKRDGVFQQVNTELIKGHGTTSERNTYTWTDTSAKPNVIYYYQIQDVSLDGQVQTLRISRLKGNVSAAGKVTTTWGELKSLQ